MQLGHAALEAKVTVEALDLALREVTETIVRDAFGRDIDAHIAARSTGLHADLAPPERAGHDVKLATFVAEAVLHENADCTTQCVQAERRVVADHRHGGYG